MREPRAHTRSVLLKLIPRYFRGRLIDVGAGRAKYRGLIDPYITEYVTVDDLSSGDQYKNENDRERVKYVSDAARLPFGDNEFDSALCSQLIEHVESPSEVVKEIFRVLKPGGHLILASGWMASFHEEPKDYWRFTVDGYRHLGETAGFEFVEAVAQGGMFTSLLYLPSRNIELRGKNWMRKALRKMSPVVRIFELVAEALDDAIPSPDAVGHTVVFKKP